MKAESDIRPSDYIIFPSMNDRSVILLRENITEETRTTEPTEDSGEEATTQTVYVWDEYSLTTNTVDNLETMVSNSFEYWLNKAKEIEEANDPTTPSVVEIAVANEVINSEVS